MKNGVDGKGREWEERSLFGKMIDISGRHFERLTVLFPVMSKNKKKWLCKCDCGNDGQQHNKPYEYFGGVEKFLTVRKNDTLKNQYALSHNIPLVRIPYSKRDSMTLDDILGDSYLYKTIN